jgi:hypothetical protein
LHPAFQVHRLSAEGLARAEELAERFDALLTFITEHVEPTREYSLAVTKLEEASFYAKKALAQSHAA